MSKYMIKTNEEKSKWSGVLDEKELVTTIAAIYTRSLWLTGEYEESLHKKRYPDSTIAIANQILKSFAPEVYWEGYRDFCNEYATLVVEELETFDICENDDEYYYYPLYNVRKVQ